MIPIANESFRLMAQDLRRGVIEVQEEQQLELRGLRLAVARALREGAHVPAGARLLRFTILPWFEDPMSWEIRELPRSQVGERLALHEVRWAFLEDLETFRSPVERLRHPHPFVPRIIVRSAEIEAEGPRRIFASFAATRIAPGFESNCVGLDGTTYELELASGRNRLLLSWWNAVPSAWSEIEGPLQDLRSIFDAAEERLRGSPEGRSMR